MEAENTLRIIMTEIIDMSGMPEPPSSQKGEILAPAPWIVT
jgi:hypothetical protein